MAVLDHARNGTGQDGECQGEERQIFVRRAELVLAHPPHVPLRDVPLDPDPLVQLAQAFAQARPELDEDVDVCLDLLPVTPHRRRRFRRQLGKKARDGSGLSDAIQKGLRDARAELGIDGGRQPATPRDRVDMVEQRHGMQDFGRKTDAGEAMFETQLLIRVQSRYQERADGLARTVLSAFQMYAKANHLKVSGVNLGVAFLGSDMPGRRGFFDRRMSSGLFAPTGATGVLTDGELLGFLKPTTRRCSARAVWRSGPYMPPPPALPEYLDRNGNPRRGVLPLGLITRRSEQTITGMNMREFLFGAICGRSGMGKSTTALGQFLHVALIERGIGAMFFDPHAPNALDRAAPFLTAPGVRERVILMDLSDKSDHRHVAWNLFAMSGLTEQHVAERSIAISDSLSLAAGGSFQGRSSAILENGVTALLHLSLIAPAELSPTIFTLPTFLTNEQFRQAVVAKLPEHLRGFWNNEFTEMPAGATLPVCQLISRLQNNPTVRATFGSPISTFDPRQAMDAGAIILAAPPSVDDRIVCSLIMRGFIDGARSRGDVPEDARRVSWWFMDEAQTWDIIVRGTSALATIFEQLRKYGVRCVPMTQNPGQFVKPTWAAIRTNASLVATYGTEPDAAKEFSTLWAGVDAQRAVALLPAHQFIVQATHQGLRGDPFRVHGIPETALFPQHYHPEQVGELTAAIDARCRPRTVTATLEAIKGHDKRILAWLRGGGGPGGNGGAPAPAGPRAPSGPGGFALKLVDPAGGPDPTLFDQTKEPRA